jgi:hypothetical protein
MPNQFFGWAHKSLGQGSWAHLDQILSFQALDQDTLHRFVHGVIEVQGPYTGCLQALIAELLS